MGERRSIAQKGVRAISEKKMQLEMARMLQNPVFALPDCQPINANILLCDTLGLAEIEGRKLSRDFCRRFENFSSGGRS